MPVGGCDNVLKSLNPAAHTRLHRGHGSQGNVCIRKLGTHASTYTLAYSWFVFVRVWLYLFAFHVRTQRCVFMRFWASGKARCLAVALSGTFRVFCYTWVLCCVSWLWNNAGACVYKLWHNVYRWLAVVQTMCQKIKQMQHQSVTQTRCPFL